MAARPPAPVDGIRASYEGALRYSTAASARQVPLPQEACRTSSPFRSSSLSLPLNDYGARFSSTAMGQLVSAEQSAGSYKWRPSGVPHHSFYNFFWRRLEALSANLNPCGPLC